MSRTATAGMSLGFRSLAQQVAVKISNIGYNRRQDAIGPASPPGGDVGAADRERREDHGTKPGHANHGARSRLIGVRTAGWWTC
jgi:hypothetical protein